jgi:hypothetical protein
MTTSSKDGFVRLGIGCVHEGVRGFLRACRSGCHAWGFCGPVCGMKVSKRCWKGNREVALALRIVMGVTYLCKHLEELGIDDHVGLKVDKKMKKYWRMMRRILLGKAVGLPTIMVIVLESAGHPSMAY